MHSLHQHGQGLGGISRLSRGMPWLLAIRIRAASLSEPRATTGRQANEWQVCAAHVISRQNAAAENAGARLEAASAPLRGGAAGSLVQQTDPNLFRRAPLVCQSANPPRQQWTSSPIQPMTSTRSERPALLVSLCLSVLPRAPPDRCATGSSTSLRCSRSRNPTTALGATSSWWTWACHEPSARCRLRRHSVRGGFSLRAPVR